MEMLEFVNYHGLNIKDFIYLHIDGNSYGALLLGCVGHGELVLLDSANPEIEIMRTEMNIPDMHARFDRLIDVNSDGIMELEIYQSSGSHPMYLSLLSIYPDRLEFIKNDEGLSKFFASGGNVEIIDVDSDGIYEIKCDKYNRDRGASPQESKIYKWNGTVFIEINQIEYTDKQD